MVRKTQIILFFLSCITFLPLIGVLAQGKSVIRYLYFPPVTKPMPHEPFSIPLFFVGITITVLLIVGMVLLLIKNPRQHNRQEVTSSFPWWGWFGVFSMVGMWILAWSRFGWFESLQPYTFFPLWMSFILTINGLCYWKVGACPLLKNPRFFFLLFPVSSIFWWIFEYLNQFVGNWYYIGVDHNPVAYTLHASLSFSTVLPIFFSFHYFIENQKKLNGFHREEELVDVPLWLAWTSVVVGGGSLAFVGVWPELLFPLLWLSPLFIFFGALCIGGENHIISCLLKRGWFTLVVASIAGVICGFFWEMWNYFSMAKWLYSIPFVHGYQIFEMPILGYLGYFPFGVLCLLVCLVTQDIVKDF
jgi:hypothetical protein